MPAHADTGKMRVVNADPAANKASTTTSGVRDAETVDAIAALVLIGGPARSAPMGMTYGTVGANV